MTIKRLISARTLGQTFFALFIALMVNTAVASSKHIEEISPRYDLTVNLFPEAHRLEVAGTILLPADKAARPQLELSLSDLMRDLRVEVIEPKISAGAAQLQGKPPVNGSISWTIQPPRPIPAGEQVKLKFSYAGGEKIAFVFYIGAEGSFAGGNSTAWFPQIERDARSTGTLNFKVPARYTVVAPGKQINAEAQTSKGEFQFEITNPSYFSFAAARYSVIRRTTGKVPTTAYLLRPRSNINDFLDKCATVLDALTQEFGANPYGEFALVEVPTEQAGQAQFEGASGEGFIFSNGNFLDADFNVAYYGHEIAHQWWGVSIGGKWWEKPHARLMLDEALAQYGSVRVVEAIEGATAAERYRLTGYPGYIDFHSASGYFMIAAGGFDSPLANLPQGDPVPRIIADSKGFIVYDMLSRHVGREKFRRILQTITRKYAFGNISWNEFLREIETGAGQDLKWFYKQWFEQKGAPEWKFSWRQEGNVVSGTVNQTPPYYRVKVEIEAEGDERNLTKTIELNGAETKFSFPVNFRVRSVAVDPNFKVLHWTPEYLALKPAMAAYLRSNIERDAAESILKKALEQQIEPDLYGSRFLLEMGLGQFYLGQNKFQEARSHLEAAVASPSRRANVLPWAYFYLAKAAQGTNDKEAVRRAVDAAIAADAAVGGKTGVTRQARALIDK